MTLEKENEKKKMKKKFVNGKKEEHPAMKSQNKGKSIIAEIIGEEE